MDDGYQTTVSLSHFSSTILLSLPSLIQQTPINEFAVCLGGYISSSIYTHHLDFVFLDIYRYNVNAAADVAARAALEFIDKVNVTVNAIKYVATYPFFYS